MMTRERIYSVIRFCRENFHNDGAEGQSVHALCDYIDEMHAKLQGEDPLLIAVRNMTPEQRAAFVASAPSLPPGLKTIGLTIWAKETEEPMYEKKDIPSLSGAFERRAPELVHDIATSMASFIAEIDASSARVADYLERRLAPLVSLARTDERVRQALEEMARDTRKG